jgi:hypothetical protein
MIWLRSILATIPHWLYLLVATFGGAAAVYLTQIPAANLLSALTTQAGIVSLLKGAAIAGVIAVLSLLKPTTKPEADAAKALARKPPLAAVSGFLLLACAGCASSVWQQLEQTILADVENGSALSAIESFVAGLFPNLAGNLVAIDSIIQDIIDELVQTGVLPPASLPNAMALQGQLKAKLDGAKKSGALPPVSPAQRRAIAMAIHRQIVR